MLTRTALVAIGGYQRWVSPRKGWGCAYRLAHGGPGCSGFAKRAIAERGLLVAWPAIRQRFRDCHDAAFHLQGAAPEDDKRRRRRWCDGTIPDLGGCCDLCGRQHRSDPIPGGWGPTPHSGDCAPNACDCTPGGCGD